LRWQQSLFWFWITFVFFFNHFASVGQLTPKTRWTPRILERS
jgi:hypothetical protein